MRNKQAPYTEYARHYDQIGQSEFGRVSAQQLLGLLIHDGISPSSVIDLACGTGAAALEFARGGLLVTGLDLSAEMLAIARSTSVRRNLEVDWVEGDMRAFVSEQKFDLCTCFYDAVNYLPDLESVGEFATCVHEALKPGGFLAFDINTRRKLREHWDAMTVIAADDDERFLIYRSWFDEASDTSPLIVTGFSRCDDGNWTRFDEEHIEHTFAIIDVVQVLDSAEFEHVQVIDWREADPGELRPGTEEAFRVLFLARKPAWERS